MFIVHTSVQSADFSVSYLHLCSLITCSPRFKDSDQLAYKRNCIIN